VENLLEVGLTCLHHLNNLLLLQVVVVKLFTKNVVKGI